MAEMTLLRWAEAADAVAATRSTAAKVAVVAELLRSAEGEDVVRAARMFAGRVFAAGDQRTLGVGGAGLSRILLRVGAVDEATLSELWRRHADAGATARDLVAEHRPPSGGGEVTLAQLASVLAAVADARSAADRETLLADLLGRCNPAEAASVARLVSGDLRIGLREGFVEAAITQAFEATAADVERANMLTGDLGEVARLACERRLTDAAPSLFVPLRFMLASPAASPDEIVTRMGEHVWVEDKYDGIRCQVHAGDGRVELYSRDLKTITAQFPDVAAGAWPEGVILDGEILAFLEGRVGPFFTLQRRLGRRAPSQAVLEEFPAIFVAWDLLLDGEEIWLERPLRERRARLESLVLPSHVRLAHQEDIHGAGALETQFAAARARLNEGLMVKNPDSAYQPGRRGYQWMKLKRPLDTIDVVVVGAEYGHGKRHGVLSDVTFAVRRDDGELVNVGKAYTGLTDAEIAEMTDLLHETSLATYGRYHAVEPRIVLEIAFDSVQESKRHKSGYALRFPRIVTWRRDKGPEDIDTLERVRAVAEARAAEFTQRVDAPHETT